MNIKNNTINIGLKKPFSLLHISDTHFTLADGRDDERKQSLAVSRSRHFVPAPELKLTEAEDYAKEHGLTIIHTGDLIDFVSEANLDRAKKFIDENDVLFISGNHEFSLYVGEAFEDAAYRNQSLEHVSSFFNEDIRFNSRIINGVKFIGIDNSYYRFEKEQLDNLKAEVEKSLPIVLFVHNPLYEKSLFDYAFADSNNVAGYLVDAPDELLKLYPPDRYIQQKADKITEETVEYIKTCPSIKAVLSGHMHFDFESMLTEALPQYVTGMTTARVINFI